MEERGAREESSERRALTRGHVHQPKPPPRPTRRRPRRASRNPILPGRQAPRRAQPSRIRSDPSRGGQRRGQRAGRKWGARNRPGARNRARAMPPPGPKPREAPHRKGNGRAQTHRVPPEAPLSSRPPQSRELPIPTHAKEPRPHGSAAVHRRAASLHAAAGGSTQWTRRAMYHQGPQPVS